MLCNRSCRLKECSHIFMRWKEQAFAKSGDDCGLTIAGFYYISLCRQTGDVEGEDHPLQLLSPDSSPAVYSNLVPCHHWYSSCCCIC